MCKYDQIIYNKKLPRKPKSGEIACRKASGSSPYQKIHNSLPLLKSGCL